jgi:glucans biosynthesis protein
MKEEGENKPMNRAPRCSARNRAGLPCRAPAIRGKRRCKFHGGKSTGPPRGTQNALKDGLHTRAMKEMRELARLLKAEAALLR